MAESVDALVSNTSGATRAGSTPALGTGFEAKVLQDLSSQHFFRLSPKKTQKMLQVSVKCRIFAAEKRMIMAKPIEPTPVLKGDDAYEFVAEMEKLEKASAEEKARVAKGASFIQSLLTFTF